MTKLSDAAKCKCLQLIQFLLYLIALREHKYIISTKNRRFDEKKSLTEKRTNN